MLFKYFSFFKILYPSKAQILKTEILPVGNLSPVLLTEIMKAVSVSPQVSPFGGAHTLGHKSNAF